MASIVIWANRHEEEYLTGLWAISDSRISASGNIPIDNFQKLAVLNGYSYETRDFYRRHPRHVFSAGFACAGSTLVSSTVREFMAARALPTPFDWCSELDSQRYETRNLEFFPDGKIWYASRRMSSLGTELGSTPVPPLTEINQSPEFNGAAISAQNFEDLWAANVPGEA